jgi:predicted nucleic acid-binding protein
VTGWLLDTNVLSELRRPRPEPKVVGFVSAQPLEQLYVSTVTFAEIRYGIERVDDAKRRAELNDWLTHKLRPMFESRVLPVSEDVIFKWRLLVEEGRKTGHRSSSTSWAWAAPRQNGNATSITGCHGSRHRVLGSPCYGRASSLMTGSICGGLRDRSS